MKKKFAQLEEICYDHAITPETDPQFWHQVQSGLLLALQEQGLLNTVQYRRARERLEHRWRSKLL